MITGIARSLAALVAAHGRWLGSVTAIWRNLRHARRVVDADYYLANNPDVRAMGLPASLHYALFGAAEGRRPAALPDQTATSPGRLPKAESPTVLTNRAHANADRYYDDRRPAVSIIVLNHGKAALTLRCLDALWDHTAGSSYEIVLVDNGSPTDDFANLASCGGRFRLIRLAQNRFFGEGNNLGAEAARADRLLFLNNDTLVTDGWLEPLMRVLDERPDAGAVGGTLIFANHVIQEAGAMVAPDGRAIQRRRGDPETAAQALVEPVDYCSAAALLVRRGPFEEVLGFDLTWEPAFYEDVDLCLQLARAGWRTYYCAATRVVHLEHGTTGDDGSGFEGSNLVEINRLKFRSRWGRYLADRHLVAPASRPRRRRPPQTADKRELALYTPHALIPGGGERFLLTMAQAAAVDFNVTLITDTPYSRLRILQLGRDLDLDLEGLRQGTIGELRAQPSFDVFVAIDAVVLPAVAPLGHRNIFVCQFPFPLPTSELARRWGHVGGYDHIIVYSEFARRHTYAALESLALSAHPHIQILAPPVPHIGGSSVPRGPRILSVGRFYAGGHPKRHDVMIEAFRELHRVHPAVELHLAGSLHPEPQHRRYFLDLCDQARGLPVTFHVNASRQALESLYRDATVYWHATGFGLSEETSAHEMEHFGIAVVEAMSAGAIPIAVAGGGPVELITPGVSGFLFHGVHELCEQTTRILSEPDAGWIHEMRDSAIATSQRFTVDVFSTAVKQLLSPAPPLADRLQ